MKNKLLLKLKESNSQYVSGEALSEAMGVTRAAVWKHIRELREEGYVIEASSRKGYRLLDSGDMLNKAEILSNLETKVIGKDIQYFDELDSTNIYAKKLAYEGCGEGTVIVADRQTAGRGRLGRQWDSPAGLGISMSVVLRPMLPPEDVQVITLAASVAVVSAIRHITGIQAGIKWPNDIILDGRKVCGILTEMNCEIERVNFIVLGIGVNVNHKEEDFPEELSPVATSLRLHSQRRDSNIGEGRDIEEGGDIGKGRDIGKSRKDGSINRARLIARILFELERIYSKIKANRTDEILDEWKKYSVTIGKRIKVMDKSGEYSATAMDITKDGRLLVRCDNGTEREILSGEVSVRGMLGYS